MGPKRNTGRKVPQPLPMVVLALPAPMVEEEVVVQPPPQPQPIVEEEEEVVQPPPPIPPEILPNAASSLANAERYRIFVATGMEAVISRCVEAKEKLNGILATLFNYPGPVDATADLVGDFFFNPDPDIAPLQAARRDLRYLVDVALADILRHFRKYAEARGLRNLTGGHGAFSFLVLRHEQAEFEARKALEWLDYVALERSYRDDALVRACCGMSTLRERTEAGPRVSTAVTSLQQTIAGVEKVLVELRKMRISLVELEKAALNLARVPDPPSP